MEALELLKERQAQTKEASQTGLTDSYVTSFSSQTSDILPIPTGTYNASGFEENDASREQMPGAVPPPPKPEDSEETDETTETEETALTSSISTTGYEDLLAQLSDTFRANPESILMTMENLGLDMDDLSEEDNLTKLADAMSEGAAGLGLPSAGNVDDLVSSLSDYLAARSENASNVSYI